MDKDSNYAAVARVLSIYFDGLYRSDTAKLREAFHPLAIYACATGGELQHLDMTDYFAIVDNRPSPASRGEARRDRIVSIEFAGPVTAFARVNCSIGPKDFTDFLTLALVGGKWRKSPRSFTSIFGTDFRDSQSRSPRMPYVNIKITREGATPAQKAQLIKGTTDLLVHVLNKTPATTVVVIDEVERNDWGIAGLPVEDYRRRSAS